MSATAGENKVNLRWADPGDSSISNYEIRQKEGSGTFSIWEGIEGSSATTRSHEVTGLTNDTTYTFEVRAIGDGGQSEASSVSATPASGEAAPGAMVNLQAAVSGVSGGNGGKVRFTWDNPNDISIDKYQFRYSSISTFEGFKDWADVPSSSATTVSYPTGAGTIFIHGTSGPVFYELRAVNDPSGDEVFPGPAAAIQVTRENSPGTSTNPPGAPGALDPEISPLQLVLKWTAPTTGTVSSYQYRQKEGNGNFGDWMGISGSSSSTTSYTVSGLTDGTSYTFEVRAVDNNGTTNDDSDDLFGAAAAFGPVTPRPRQPNPPILHLSPSTSTSITELDWTAVDPPAGVTPCGRDPLRA